MSKDNKIKVPTISISLRNLAKILTTNFKTLTFLMPHNKSTFLNASFQKNVLPISEN